MISGLIGESCRGL